MNATLTNAKRWKAGDAVPALILETINSTSVSIPEGLTHLQLRRFAGCPVCNLHLRSFVGRIHELEEAGVREVVVFHSRPEELREHAADLPFAVVADPGKRYYTMFGAESGRRALLDPRVWWPILKAIALSLGSVLRSVLRPHKSGPDRPGRKPLPSFFPEGGRWGLPADLLIDRDGTGDSTVGGTVGGTVAGTVIAVKYGEHAYDQWTVDEVLELAKASRRHRPRAAAFHQK